MSDLKIKLFSILNSIGPSMSAQQSEDISEAFNELDRLRAEVASLKDERDRAVEGHRAASQVSAECTKKLHLCEGSYYVLDAENESFAQQLASLKEQNALLAAQGQRCMEALEGVVDSGLLIGPTVLHDMVLKQVYEAIHSTTELPQNKSEDARECRWTPMDDENMPGTYEGTCGVAWSFTEGGIKENDTRYCPRCGGKIVDVAAISAQEGRGL